MVGAGRKEEEEPVSSVRSWVRSGAPPELLRRISGARAAYIRRRATPERQFDTAEQTDRTCSGAPCYLSPPVVIFSYRHLWA